MKIFSRVNNKVDRVSVGKYFTMYRYVDIVLHKYTDNLFPNLSITNPKVSSGVCDEQSVA